MLIHCYCNNALLLCSNCSTPRHVTQGHKAAAAAEAAVMAALLSSSLGLPTDRGCNKVSGSRLEMVTFDSLCLGGPTYIFRNGPQVVL